MAQQKELMLNLLKTFVSSALLLFSSRFSSFFPCAVLVFIMQGGRWEGKRGVARINRRGNAFQCMLNRWPSL